jgi:hypothetical protein
MSIVPAVPGDKPGSVLPRYAVGLRSRAGAGAHTTIPDGVLLRYTVGKRLRADQGTHTITWPVPRDITRPED